MDLVYKHEKTLFKIAAFIASIFWLVLLFGTFGTLLVYLLLAYVFFLFIHSVFISHLKGTGVRITDEQYPDLHKRLLRCCETVELKEVPEAYLLRTDFFNALATKFMGRHYVVLFTDVLDALEDQPGAVDFYIGHELGHIHRRHLIWGWFIVPATILPVLGAALHRAQEYSCDRYGAACCESEADLCAALATIAAGDTRWKTLNKEAYLNQVQETSGFWMSFNELTSDYPWMTKRMATVLALKQGKEITHPRRNFFAGFLSIFIPRIAVGGGGGLMSLILAIAIIGILAAVAIPSYQDYTTRAYYSQSISEASSIKIQITEYVIENDAWPPSLIELGYESETINDPAGHYNIGVYDEGMIGINVGTDLEGADKWIVLLPTYEDGNISWQCYGENVEEKSLPTTCRE
jgi:Zn-dependent protease with chaperone function/type II secretory pathway pseudopilin PulG